MHLTGNAYVYNCQTQLALHFSLLAHNISMEINETITYEAGSKEAWICICKNTELDYGFHSCDRNGNEIQPVKNKWDGLYVCLKCGRIIDQKTFAVVGRILTVEISA